MSAGDSWSRTVSISSIDKGYYQIAAHVSASAAPGTLSPYIGDDAHREAWLLVNTGGGFLAGVFDTDAVPAGFAPVPGPFRLAGSSPVNTSQAAAYSDTESSDAAIAVTYYVTVCCGDTDYVVIIIGIPFLERNTLGLHERLAEEWGGGAQGYPWRTLADGLTDGHANF